MDDSISRQAAIDAIEKAMCEDGFRSSTGLIHKMTAYEIIRHLPPAQPEIIWCKNCIYYDPPHVENNGVRYEYAEMPADAFDELGTGLVNVEYGINIGGRCCRDYNAGYDDDKRVFVPEKNYCGRAKRRTDEQSDFCPNCGADMRGKQDG